MLVEAGGLARRETEASPLDQLGRGVRRRQGCLQQRFAFEFVIARLGHARRLFVHLQRRGMERGFDVAMGEGCKAALSAFDHLIRQEPTVEAQAA